MTFIRVLKIKTRKLYKIVFTAPALAFGPCFRPLAWIPALDPVQPLALAQGASQLPLPQLLALSLRSIFRSRCKEIESGLQPHILSRLLIVALLYLRDMVRGRRPFNNKPQLTL